MQASSERISNNLECQLYNTNRHETDAITNGGIYIGAYYGSLPFAANGVSTAPDHHDVPTKRLSLFVSDPAGGGDSDAVREWTSRNLEQVFSRSPLLDSARPPEAKTRCRR